MAVVTGQSFGNFQIVRLLGEGGFGEVYEAVNPFLQRRAAIKIMHTGMDQDPELVRRFLNEARAASAIRHPNIIDVFDAGVTAEGEPYILMEFLEGESLQRVIQQQAPIPLGTVQEIARQAGSALAAAHQAGIVHRDLKPENLYLIPDASAPMGFRIKVLDFGIAKVRHRDEQASTLKTQAGLLMGSPSYMSPEQCRDSSDVDLRSDIYSFGIIVYEMLVGAPPFVSQSATEMLVMQLTADPPPLQARLPDLPEHVEQSVMRALAKDREKRFGTVDYFVGALQGTHPALTLVGSTPSGVPADLPPGQSMSFYSAQGFGHQKTPAPVLVSGFASRSGFTPAPVALPNQTITTLSQARGEAVSPSPESSIHAELEAVRPKRWPWLVGALGAAVAAVLFLTLRPHPTSPAGAGPAATAGAAARPPAAPASIRIEIRSTPAGATVFKTTDGTVLGMTPLDRAYPQATGTMNVLLRLAGHQDKTVPVRLDGSSVTVVELASAKAAAPAAPPTAAPPTSPKQPGRVRKPPRVRQDKEEEWRVH